MKVLLRSVGVVLLFKDVLKIIGLIAIKLKQGNTDYHQGVISHACGELVFNDKSARWV